MPKQSAVSKSSRGRPHHREEIFQELYAALNAGKLGARCSLLTKNALARCVKHLRGVLPYGRDTLAKWSTVWLIQFHDPITPHHREILRRNDPEALTHLNDLTAFFHHRTERNRITPRGQKLLRESRPVEEQKWISSIRERIMKSLERSRQQRAVEKLQKSIERLTEVIANRKNDEI